MTEPIQDANEEQIPVNEDEVTGQETVSKSDAAEAFANDLIDQFVPDGFEWESAVKDYPWPALALAAVGGFMLGRNRGTLVLGALATFAAAQVSGHVNQFIGEDII